MDSPNIFKYLDYRHYLADLFTYLKSTRKRFSLRELGRMAGSTSPNFLQLITERKLNISAPGIRNLSANAGLKKKEGRFLEYLVAFDHAKTHDEKDRFFRKMINTRQYQAVKKLDKDQYEYFAHWYNPVVRELLMHPGFTGDPAWIADRIHPRVSLPSVKRSIRLLQDLRLVIQDPASGRWLQTNVTVSTPAEVISLAVTNYHRAVITLGKDALTKFSEKERDYRSATIGVSKTKYNEIKKRLVAFWQEVLAEAETEDKPEEIYQLNMQFFPLTKKQKKKHT